MTECSCCSCRNEEKHEPGKELLVVSGTAALLGAGAYYLGKGLTLIGFDALDIASALFISGILVMLFSWCFALLKTEGSMNRPWYVPAPYAQISIGGFIGGVIIAFIDSSILVMGVI